MKVFFVLSVAFPSYSATAKRVINYALGLQAAGIETEVITLSAKGDDAYCSKVIYKHIGKGYTSAAFSKTMTSIYNTKELVKYLKNHTTENDIILLYTASLLDVFLPILLGKKYHYICEMNEVPFYSHDFKSRYDRKLYFALFKNFDGVITISEPLYQLAHKHKSKQCQVIKIPILVDCSKYATAGKQVGDDDKIDAYMPYIFHSGSFTENKDGFSGMIQALSLVKKKYNETIHLVCTSNPPSNPLITSTIKQCDFQEHIRFLGNISEESLMNWQSKSLMFIVNKNDSFQNRFCFATKMGEYLASEKLVITTDVGEHLQYLKNDVNAIIVHTGDIDELADKIYFYYKNDARRQEIAIKGREVAEKYFDYIPNGEILKSFLLQISHSQKV